MTLANRLTLLRIFLIPALVLMYCLPLSWSGPAAAYLFLFCSLTDWLDGYLARWLDQVSEFGRFLDPVADKLLVVVTLVLLVERHSSLWMALPAMVIVSREVAVSALREWMAELGERALVAVSTIGKVKTGLQMTALVMLLYENDLFGLPIFLIGGVLLYLATFLTLWSMLVYLRAARPLFNGDSGQ